VAISLFACDYLHFPSSFQSHMSFSFSSLYMYSLSLWILSFQEPASQFPSILAKPQFAENYKTAPLRLQFIKAPGMC
jgi:hypothetical protein